MRSIKQTILLLVLGVSFTNCNTTKTTAATSMTETRTINVTGTAEKEVSPDIIVFTLTIKEYWEEEFIKGMKYEDYKTKVPMTKIEPQILATLKKFGIKDNQIKVGNAGNYYRQAGKDFLVSKSLQITVGSFEVLDNVMKAMDSRGVSNMFISELKHSKMDEFEKEVKIAALKNAQEKADYLLESVGEKRGKVLLINESEYGFEPPIRYYNEVALKSNANTNAATELKDIKITFRVNVTFAIAG